MAAFAIPKVSAVRQAEPPVTGTRAVHAHEIGGAAAAPARTPWNFADVPLYPPTGTILRKRIDGSEPAAAPRDYVRSPPTDAMARQAGSPAATMARTPGGAADTGDTLLARPRVAWNFARVPLHPPVDTRPRDRAGDGDSPAAAEGYVLSSPMDAREQEADARADMMLRALSHEAHASGGADAPRPALRPLPAATSPAEPTLAAQFGSGRALDPHLRARVEPLLGHDLSAVRVYPYQADGLASVWQARAFTVGHSVFFRARDWQPESHDGMGLLLHELVHTTQPADARTIGRKASVAAWEFHNKDGGKTSTDNCCVLCPINLGVDSQAYGQGSFTNGMELKAFLNDEPGATYDVKRVRETSAFAKTNGTWSRFLHEGPNKPDDSNDDDECLTPQVTAPSLPYVYSVDAPGMRSMGAFASDSEVVYQSNFIESVAITANGATSQDSKTFDWYAIVWVANQSGSGWSMDKTRSKIEPGHTVLGTTAP